jgi:hypothetical protein
VARFGVVLTIHHSPREMVRPRFPHSFRWQHPQHQVRFFKHQTLLRCLDPFLFVFIELAAVFAQRVRRFGLSFAKFLPLGFGQKSVLAFAPCIQSVSRLVEGGTHGMVGRFHAGGCLQAAYGTNFISQAPGVNLISTTRFPSIRSSSSAWRAPRPVVWSTMRDRTRGASSPFAPSCRQHILRYAGSLHQPGETPVLRAARII